MNGDTDNGFLEQLLLDWIDEFWTVTVTAIEDFFSGLRFVGWLPAPVTIYVFDSLLDYFQRLLKIPTKGFALLIARRFSVPPGMKTRVMPAADALLLPIESLRDLAKEISAGGIPASVRTAIRIKSGAAVSRLLRHFSVQLLGRTVVTKMVTSFTTIVITAMQSSMVFLCALAMWWYALSLTGTFGQLRYISRVLPQTRKRRVALVRGYFRLPFGSARQVVSGQRTVNQSSSPVNLER